MARRRRAGEDAVTVIYWRDIPAQVTATVGGRTHKALLEQRFQHAIDRAATVAELTETEAYIAQWRRDSRPLDGDPTAAATRIAEELGGRYPQARLERLVAAGGLDVEPETEPDAGPHLNGAGGETA